MKFSFFRKIFFFLFVSFLFQSSFSFSQSIDDEVDYSPPLENKIPNPPPIKPESYQPSEKILSIFSDSFTNSSFLGIPDFSSLIDFISKLIDELFPSLKKQTQSKPPEIQIGKKKTDPKPKPPANTIVEPPSTEKKPVDPVIPHPIGESKAGSEFIKRTSGMGRAQREEEILKAIENGNIPAHLKTFKEIRIKMKLKDGKEHEAVYKVLPDYLSIGTDQDFVRMPMNPLTAQKIAEKLGCLLPTSKMVDDIYQAAKYKMAPQPMSGGNYANWQSRMMKNEFYQEHQRLVEGQRQKSGHQLGELVAGHKKDVIISNALDTHPKSVIIYGWHDKRNNGKPIQGTSWIHENTYADYSHGVRLVQGTMTVDGKEMAVSEVLKDPVLSALLSKEGPIKTPRACR